MSTPATPNAPPLGPAKAEQPAAAPKPITLRFGLILALGLLAAFLLSTFKALLIYGGIPHTDEDWGYVVGTALGPFVLSSLIVGIYYATRKPRRAPRRIAAAFVLWTLGFAFFTRIPRGPLSMPESKQELGQVMAKAYREASGAIPPEKYSKDDLTATLRESFREVLKFRQEYDKAAKQFQTPEMQGLWTAGSFRSKQVVSETLRQLKNMAETEQKYSSMEPLIMKIEGQFRNKDWPERTKAAFLDGYWEAFRKQDKLRLEVYRKEREWLDASIDLYTFVANNHSMFVIRGDQVLVRNDETLAGFNQKLSHATELHKVWLKAVEDFEMKQKTDIADYGITPSDLGNPGP